jgi:hypothetical protein
MCEEGSVEVGRGETEKQKTTDNRFRPMSTISEMRSTYRNVIGNLEGERTLYTSGCS